MLSSTSFRVGLGSLVAAFILSGAIVGMANVPAAAKPEYAAKTGKACGGCHVNPGGAGKLNASGEAYKKSKK